jgi:hypothetical protein
VCGPPPLACVPCSQARRPPRAAVLLEGVQSRRARQAFGRPAGWHRYQRRWSGAPAGRRSHQSFWWSSPRQNSPARRGSERLRHRDDPHRRGARLKLDRCGKLLRPNKAMKAVAKGAMRSKKSDSVRSPSPRVADQQREEINGFIRSEPSAY